VATAGGRRLALRLPTYHELAPATRIRLDVSTELRTANQFDVAIRSGFGGWSNMQTIPLLPVLGTPMLSPALAERHPLRTPADLQDLPLIPDVNWRPWFRQVGITDPRLHLTSTTMTTQDMAAAAAVGGTGVALLSPVLFADLLDEALLVRPFESLFVGPETYYVLRHKGDDRPETAHFVQWLCDRIAAEWTR
jgi:LysR family glycine cleavage system transcriptional activator